MGNQWESHNAVINYGTGITRKIIDVSQRVFRQDQIKRAQERNMR